MIVRFGLIVAFLKARAMSRLAATPLALSSAQEVDLSVGAEAEMVEVRAEQNRLILQLRIRSSILATTLCIGNSVMTFDCAATTSLVGIASTLAALGDWAKNSGRV